MQSRLWLIREMRITESDSLVCSIHKRVVQRLVIFGLLNCLLELEGFGLEWNALHARIRWFGVINGNHRQNDKTQV